MNVQLKNPKIPNTDATVAAPKKNTQIIYSKNMQEAQSDKPKYCICGPSSVAHVRGCYEGWEEKPSAPQTPNYAKSVVESNLTEFLDKRTQEKMIPHPKSEGWEEEFDKKFTSSNYQDSWNKPTYIAGPKNIKGFIAEQIFLAESRMAAKWARMSENWVTEAEGKARARATKSERERIVKMVEDFPQRSSALPPKIDKESLLTKIKELE